VLLKILILPKKKRMTILSAVVHSVYGRETVRDPALTSVAGRELRIAVLTSLRELALVFGREGSHDFLLPHLISFMNDASWEVRAAFCEEVATLGETIGRVL